MIHVRIDKAAYIIYMDRPTERETPEHERNGTGRTKDRHSRQMYGQDMTHRRTDRHNGRHTDGQTERGKV